MPGRGEAEALGREKLLPKYWLSRPFVLSPDPFLLCVVLSFCLFLCLLSVSVLYNEENGRTHCALSFFLSLPSLMPKNDTIMRRVKLPFSRRALVGMQLYSTYRTVLATWAINLTTSRLEQLQLSVRQLQRVCAAPNAMRAIVAYDCNCNRPKRVSESKETRKKCFEGPWT